MGLGVLIYLEYLSANILIQRALRLMPDKESLSQWMIIHEHAVKVLSVFLMESLNNHFRNKYANKYKSNKLFNCLFFLYFILNAKNVQGCV